MNATQKSPPTASGSCVGALQQLLWNWGYGQIVGSIDQSFGGHTLAAVEAFQRSAGLSVDGQVGPNTKAALYSVSNPTLESSRTHVEAFTSPSVCLDADTNTAGQNGQKIHSVTCNGGTNQDWEEVAIPYHSGRFMVVNMGDGLCLDADLGTAGQEDQVVQGHQCNGQTNQEWSWITTVNTGTTVLGEFKNIEDGDLLSWSNQSSAVYDTKDLVPQDWTP